MSDLNTKDCDYLNLGLLITRLTGPDGCAWDRDQTHASLKRNLLEECYELMDAIDNNDHMGIVEELGDILGQVLLHIDIAERNEKFNTQDVLTAITTKLIKRHPHVFGEIEPLNKEEVTARWESLKQLEDGNKSRLGNIPRQMPSLARSQLIQDRASLAGFDWTDMSGVIDKVREELEELENSSTQKQQEWELGDIFMSLVNLGRWMNIVAEHSLHAANERFYARFTYMEAICDQSAENFVDKNIDQKQILWEEAKKHLG
jgi:tetrapyrrole methylase family protein/MazG family protein